MTWRVLLDVNGLRVSKPGVNVLTAPDTLLTLHPNYSQLKLLSKGTHTIPSYGDSYQGYYISGKTYYGRSFSNPPLVYFSLRLPGEGRAFCPVRAGQLGMYYPGAADRIEIVSARDGFWYYIYYQSARRFAGSQITFTCWDYNA